MTSISTFLLIGSLSMIAILMAYGAIAHGEEYPLHIEFQGVQYDDYSWKVVQQLDGIHGQYDPETKTVYTTPEKTIETIVHEIEHIKCRLSYPDDRYMQITYCDFKVDERYLVQGQRPHYTPPQALEISNKMYYTSLFEMFK